MRFVCAGDTFVGLLMLVSMDRWRKYQSTDETMALTLSLCFTNAKSAVVFSRVRFWMALRNRRVRIARTSALVP